MFGWLDDDTRVPGVIFSPVDLFFFARMCPFFRPFFFVYFFHGMFWDVFFPPRNTPMGVCPFLPSVKCSFFSETRPSWLLKKHLNKNGFEVSTFHPAHKATKQNLSTDAEETCELITTILRSQNASRPFTFPPPTFLTVF